MSNSKPAVNGILLATFLAAMDGTVTATIGPVVAARLHAIVWEPFLTAIFLLCAALATPVYGRLADAHDNTHLYTLALAVFAVGSGWTAFSPTMSWLMVGRVLQGFGAGGIFTVGLIILGRLFTGSRRTTMLGRQAATWGAAAVLGPTLGGLAAQGAWWRLLFGLNVPLAVAAMRCLRATAVRPPRANPVRRFDTRGLVTLGVSLTAWLALPIVWSTHRSPLWAVAVGTLAFGALAVLVFEERTAHTPLISLDVLRHRARRGRIAASLLGSALIYALVALVPLWVREAERGSPLQVGLVALPIPLGWAMGSMFVGPLRSRWPERTALAAEVAIFAAGIALLIAASRLRAPLVWAALGGGLCGAGMGAVLMTQLLQTQEHADTTAFGSETGLFNLSRNVGNAMGPGLFGGLAVALATQSRSTPHPATQLWCTAIDVTWAVILALAAVLALVLLRTMQPDNRVETP